MWVIETQTWGMAGNLSNSPFLEALDCLNHPNRVRCWSLHVRKPDQLTKLNENHSNVLCVLHSAMNVCMHGAIFSNLPINRVRLFSNQLIHRDRAIDVVV